MVGIADNGACELQALVNGLALPSDMDEDGADVCGFWADYFDSSNDVLGDSTAAMKHLTSNTERYEEDKLQSFSRFFTILSVSHCFCLFKCMAYYSNDAIFTFF